MESTIQIDISDSDRQMVEAAGGPPDDIQTSMRQTHDPVHEQLLHQSDNSTPLRVENDLPRMRRWSSLTSDDLILDYHTPLNQAQPKVDFSNRSETSPQFYTPVGQIQPAEKTNGRSDANHQQFICTIPPVMPIGQLQGKKIRRTALVQSSVRPPIMNTASVQTPVRPPILNTAMVQAPVRSPNMNAEMVHSQVAPSMANAALVRPPRPPPASQPVSAMVNPNPVPPQYEDVSHMGNVQPIQLPVQEQAQMWARRANGTSRTILRVLAIARTSHIQFSTRDAINNQRRLVDSYWEQYYEAFLQLFGESDLDQEFIEELEDQLTQTESAYTALKTMYDQRQAEIDAIVTGAVNGDRTIPNLSQQTSEDDGIMLGTMELETFNGDSAKWPVFKDTFETYVHNRTGLTDTAKFWYLSNALAGDAKEVIDGFYRTSENYAHAWRQLVDQYEDEGKIVDDQVVRFMDISPIQNPSKKALMNLVNKTNNLIKSLAKYGINAEEWGAILVPMVRRKLDVETRRAWRSRKPPKQIAKIKTFLEFLSLRANVLEEDQSQTAGPSHANRSAVSHPPNPKPMVKPKQDAPNPCPECGDAHPIFKCGKFAAKALVYRVNKVHELGWCENCLRPGHFK